MIGFELWEAIFPDTVGGVLIGFPWEFLTKVFKNASPFISIVTAYDFRERMVWLSSYDTPYFIEWQTKMFTDVVGESLRSYRFIAWLNDDDAALFRLFHPNCAISSSPMLSGSCHDVCP